MNLWLVNSQLFWNKLDEMSEAWKFIIRNLIVLVGRDADQKRANKVAEIMTNSRNLVPFYHDKP